MYESLIKKVGVGMGSGLVGLHIKARSWASCLLSPGISHPGEGQSLLSLQGPQDLQASQCTENKNWLNTFGLVFLSSKVFQLFS